MPGTLTSLIPFNLHNSEVYTIIFRFTNEEARELKLKATQQDKQDSSPGQMDSKMYSSHFKTLHWPMSYCHSSGNGKTQNYQSIFISFKYLVTQWFSNFASFHPYLITTFPQHLSLHYPSDIAAGIGLQHGEFRGSTQEEAGSHAVRLTAAPLRKLFFLPCEGLFSTRIISKFSFFLTNT